MLFALYAFWEQTRTDARWERSSSAVGALFFGAFGITMNAPFCTASIVSSHKGNLLITAAHCLRIPETNMMFAPFYHDGIEPFGTWRVTSEVFAPGWFPDGNPNADFAFLTVNGNVQKLAGAEQLGISSPIPASVTIEGYSITGGVTVCTRKPAIIDVENEQQLKVNCSGFPNGSSGGPFLTGISEQSGMGTIVGVLGGYQQGGDSSDVEYSSPFDNSLISLYKKMSKKE